MRTDDGLRPDLYASLRDRYAAQSAITEFLRIQSLEPERSRMERVFGKSPLGTESRYWFWGVIGELEVASALAQLGTDWTTLHSVPVGAPPTEIDHLIIGPAGVFTVTAKNHSGQNVWVTGRSFTVAGHRLPHIRSAEIVVGQAENLLSSAVGEPVSVLAVIAVVDPDSLVVRDAPRDVAVVTSRQLLRWLSRQPQQLPAELIARIADAASDPVTWQSEDAILEAVPEMFTEFEKIRKTVLVARLRRQLWVLAGAIFIVGAIVIFGYVELTAGAQGVIGR